MKKLIFSLGILFLFACSKTSPNNQNDNPITPDKQIFKEPSPTVGTNFVRVKNQDVFNELIFDNVNTEGNKSYGSLIVSKTNGYPVFDGNESARFELRNGDCGWNSGFNDCATNRMRTEMYEVNPQSEIGKIISYTENIYIPAQSKFRPAGNNLMVLTQINYSDTLNTFGALAYLVMENNNTLLIRTHKDFTWDWNKNYTITTTPYDRWITIKYQIKVSDKSDGELAVFIDGNKLFSEVRPTLITKSGRVYMKFGIYNSFTDRATEPFQTQIMYFDGIRKN
jgi:hypothetical protein